MPPRIRRVPINADPEAKILTGLIVDDGFCRRTLGMLRPEHVEAKYARHVVKWVREYFEKYDKAPGMEMQTIFRQEGKKLPEAEADIIQDFLASLSTRYTEEQGHNWDYQADLARTYVRSRRLALLKEAIAKAADRGDLDKAEHAVLDFNVGEASTSEWVFPLVDKKFQQRVIERKDTGIFRMDGALGKLLGSWQRGWFIAFFGNQKVGKTWVLTEVAVQAICQGLKVAFFSEEMIDLDIGKRFLQQATALPDDPGKYKIPVWDCAQNQEGTCRVRHNGKAACKNTEPIPRNSADKLWYTDAATYKPCTFCKDNPDDYLPNYKIASWFTTVTKKHGFAQAVMERMEAYNIHYNGGNLAMKCHQRGTASLETLEGDLDELEKVYGFVPDMIITDYADILKRDGDGEERDQINRVWMGMDAVGKKRHAIKVTASQGNRKSLDRKSMKVSDAPDDIRKGAHLDLQVSINQLDDDSFSEREAMVMRLGVMNTRHGRKATDECYVLQGMDLGQPMLDTFAMSAAHDLGWRIHKSDIEAEQW